MQTLTQSRTPHPEAVKIMQEYVLQKNSENAAISVPDAFGQGVATAHMEFDDIKRRPLGTYGYTLFMCGREMGRAALGLEMEPM